MGVNVTVAVWVRVGRPGGETVLLGRGVEVAGMIGLFSELQLISHQPSIKTKDNSLIFLILGNVKE
jgi:hypothetical protein